jgi:tRNA modification GTPase
MMARPDTIAAIATAPGRGAIGIVRVSGARLSPLIEAVTGRELPPRFPVLCDFQDAHGQLIDHGLAIRFPAPHSYTGEEVLELHGHGGPMVLRILLNRCLELGARVAAPGEFTQRAFLNGKLDLAQAEAVIDLIDAATGQAARCAARSMSGEFSSKIQSVMNLLVGLRTLVEAALDFPEEELESLDSARIASGLRELAQEVDNVLDASRQGSLLREGADVVLAGQPNVGKSSLLNQLAGEDIAIVTDVPGTTRDAIRQMINLEGVPLRIIDTAGLRSSSDAVEAIGIARAWEAVTKADFVLLLLDARLGETAADREIVSQVPEGLPCIKVINKIDLVPEVPRVERSPGPGETATVWLSAKTGAGVELLKDVLLQSLGWRGTTEGLYMARERHLHALAGTRSHITEAGRHMAALDLFAEELRLAQLRLAEITGKFSADDLLGEIFARFCIGK